MAKKKKKLRTHLTEVEMLKYELNHQKEIVRNNNIDILKLKKSLFESQMVQLQKEVTIKLREIEITDLKNTVERQQHLKFDRELKEELEVTSLGYNPDTGEIVRE